MASDFVAPDSDTLPLSGGRWIEVKRRLNAGERRRVFGRMVKEMAFGQRTTVNPEMVGLSKLVEYLVAWSMKDDAGKSVPVSETAINNLDPDVYDEMVAALDAHEAKIEAQRAAEKNGQDGVNSASVISPSPSVATGASSGSVN